MIISKQLDDLPQARISIGEVLTSGSPLVIKTLLGSCVAVCLYDPVSGKGGLNHISLPGNSPDNNARYAVHAMELLINNLMSMGCSKKTLVAKAFGGGNVLNCIRTAIGTRNAEFVTAFLADENIPIIAQQLGGTAALEVFFRTDTGYVLLRTLSATQRQSVVKRERTSSRESLTLTRSAEPEETILF